MDISTQFLTDYLLERNLNWEAFDAFSPMAAVKKEQLIANWRFGDFLDAEDVKKVFKSFKGVYVDDKPVEELSFDNFINAYVKTKAII